MLPHQSARTIYREYFEALNNIRVNMLIIESFLDVIAFQSLEVSRISHKPLYTILNYTHELQALPSNNTYTAYPELELR
jgi:hypothetical protein